jgi:hypothetical protein
MSLSVLAVSLVESELSLPVLVSCVVLEELPEFPVETLP